MTSRSSKSNGNPVPSMHNRHPLNASLIGDFKIGQKLGQGTFSKVCQGVHLPTGEKVAIKIMSKDQIKEKSDKIRIEKIHTPSLALRWETAQEQHLRILRQERFERMILHTVLVASDILCVQIGSHCFIQYCRSDSGIFSMA